MLASLKSLLSEDETRRGAPRPTAARIAAAFAAGNLVVVALFVLIGAADFLATDRHIAERERLAEVAQRAAAQPALAERVAILGALATGPQPPADAAAGFRDALDRFRADQAQLAGVLAAPPDASAIRAFLDAAAVLAADPRQPAAPAKAAALREAASGPVATTLRGAAEAEAARAAGRGWWLTLLAHGPLLLIVVLLPAALLLVLLPLARRVRRMATRLEAEALTDPLTGLANRRAFLGAIRGLHAAGEREAAVILLDLTRLRDINESVGQAAGDAALREFAARLLPAVAEIPSRRGHPPLVARLSGDEFAVVLPVHSGDRQLEEIAARLCFAATAAPVLHEGRPLVIRAAAGATAILGDDPAQALEAATMALREARRDMERPVRVFSPDRDARRLLIRRAVLDALAAGNLDGVHAALQPVVSAKDLRVVGFEALARWDLPELGTLEPGQFLPLVAEAGRLPEVGRAARYAALGAFAGLRRAGLPAPRLALNLSAGELASPGLVPDIRRELQEVGLVPADIEIEITEEVVADGIDDETRAHLVAMQAAGAGILLDDFGTGAASLSQLLRMPVQAIKMDRSFVQAIGVDPRLERLVEATIRFGHAVGAKVVAEGVETAEQQEFLRRAGCDTLQGYFVARPMKLGVLGRWLRERPVPAIAAAEAGEH